MMNSMYKKFPWMNTDSGLLALRIGVGAIFIYSGWMKVSDMGMTVDMFASMGFNSFWAYVATFAELLGGIGVLLGICTRFAAKLLLIVMIVATYVVVQQNPTMAIGPVSLLFSNLALLLAGGGKYSLMRE